MCHQMGWGLFYDMELWTTTCGRLENMCSPFTLNPIYFMPKTSSIVTDSFTRFSHAHICCQVHCPVRQNQWPKSSLWVIWFDPLWLTVLRLMEPFNRYLIIVWSFHKWMDKSIAQNVQLTWSGQWCMCELYWWDWAEMVMKFTITKGL